MFLTFFLYSCEDEDPRVNPGSEPETDQETIIEGLHLGVIGFNDTVSTIPITNNIVQINTFIDKLENETDATAMCYGISEGIEMLKQLDNKQDIDEAYIVVFTDGFDNYSANYFENVYQPDVIDKTKELLEKSTVNNNPIKCYTIGLEGNGVLKDSELEKLAVNGEYKKADPNTLSATFNDIANSLIANSTNFSFMTNAVPISELNPKLVQIEVNVSTNTESPYYNTDTFYINGEFYNPDGKSPVFKASRVDDGLAFNGSDGNKIEGDIEKYNGINKVLIPLKNLTFTPSNSNEKYYINEVNVRIKWNTSENWVEDVEDSRIIESIAKNIAVVLTLDCSSSLGSYFDSLKDYSKDLIKVLSESKTDE